MPETGSIYDEKLETEDTEHGPDAEDRQAVTDLHDNLRVEMNTAGNTITSARVTEAENNLRRATETMQPTDAFDYAKGELLKNHAQMKTATDPKEQATLQAINRATTYMMLAFKERAAAAGERCNTTGISGHCVNAEHEKELTASRVIRRDERQTGARKDLEMRKESSAAPEAMAA